MKFFICLISLSLAALPSNSHPHSHHHLKKHDKLNKLWNLAAGASSIERCLINRALPTWNNRFGVNNKEGFRETFFNNVYSCCVLENQTSCSQNLEYLSCRDRDCASDAEEKVMTKYRREVLRSIMYNGIKVDYDQLVVLTQLPLFATDLLRKREYHHMFTGSSKLLISAPALVFYDVRLLDMAAANLIKSENSSKICRELIDSRQEREDTHDRARTAQQELAMWPAAEVYSDEEED